MTSGFESAINDAMAELDKQRKDLVRLQQSLDQVTATVKARRRQVSATANARGEITELKFHGHGYRTMSANELAKVILQTVQEARQAAQKEMWTAIADTLPEGADMEDVVAGNYDWSQELSGAMQLPQSLTDLLAQAPSTLFDETGFGALFDATFGEPTRGAGNGRSTPNNGAQAAPNNGAQAARKPSERGPRQDQ